MSFPQTKGAGGEQLASLVEEAGKDMNKCYTWKPSQPPGGDDLSFSLCWPTFLSHVEHLLLNIPHGVWVDLRAYHKLLYIIILAKGCVLHHGLMERVITLGNPNKAALNSDMKLSPIRTMFCVPLSSHVPFIRNHRSQARIHVICVQWWKIPEDLE